jgi:hemolysin III
MAKTLFPYSPAEETINVLSHGFGAVSSVFALIFLIAKSISSGDKVKIISSLVYGISMLVLYTASTIYHAEKNESKRKRFKTLDHIAIFYLIAGTYTPFVLIILPNKIGWIVFAIVWGIALLGTLLKWKYTGRFNILSTMLYVAMGWIVVFVYNPLTENLSPEGLYWLMAGGIAYTIGAIAYVFNKLEFAHAFFHIMVLIGSFCHFWSIYHYVL